MYGIKQKCKYKALYGYQTVIVLDLRKSYPDDNYAILYGISYFKMQLNHILVLVYFQELVLLPRVNLTAMNRSTFSSYPTT